MLSQLRPAIVSTVLFTLLLGLVYPLAITCVAGLIFPDQAGGSLIRDGKGQVIGSALIGQLFAADEYLHPRPSAAGKGYDASASSGSNYGPLSPDLIKRVQDDAAAVRQSTGLAQVPAEAVTTSGSGLDPDISPTYALAQAPRIAAERGAGLEAVRAVIQDQVQGPWLGFIGQPRLNVLRTNLALDARFPRAHPDA